MKRTAILLMLIVASTLLFTECSIRSNRDPNRRFRIMDSRGYSYYTSSYTKDSTGCVDFVPYRNTKHSNVGSVTLCGSFAIISSW